MARNLPRSCMTLLCGAVCACQLNTSSSEQDGGVGTQSTVESGVVEPSVGSPVQVAQVVEVVADPPTCPDLIPDLMDARKKAAKGRTVVVFKHDYLLGFYQDGQLARVGSSPGSPPACFPVAMGQNPSEPKTTADHASTPEGWYRVGGKLPLGVSHYHQALSVSYPNGEDADRAFSQGVITASVRDQIKAADNAQRMPPQHTAMGGEIMIHGNGSRPRDWTWGCVAMDNADIDWLFSQVKTGDNILLLPWSVSLE